ncbi:hypothetical protein [Amycolatopsis sp. NPDC051716]|uniref:hypothetical protein n=1 Tax=Amycolatopsis sp. NPDC051716 TaxID=3155804 RepID=UPI003446BBAA
MARGSDFSRHLLISLDVQGYGGRDDRQHASIQSGLLAVADTAAVRCGLDRTTWHRQGAGDGELAILPPGTPEPVVVDDYVRELVAALADHNHDLAADARMRIRIAIHHGVAMPGANGWTGQGVVGVSRLVDSAPVRGALRAFPDADLAVLVSRQIYTDVVAQRHTSLKPGEFREVVVRQKEFTDVAWLRVPGHDVHGARLSADPPPAEPAGTRVTAAAGQHYRAEAITVVNGSVDAANAVFGIKHGS